MGKPADLLDCAWPAEELGDAMVALARAGGLDAAPLHAAPPAHLAGTDLDRWIALAAARAGIEAEAVEASYGDVARLVRRSAPALFRLPGSGVYVALVAGGRRRVEVLDRQLRRRRVAADSLCAAMREDLDKQVARGIDEILDRTSIRGARRDSARAALLAERLSGHTIGNCWLLDLSAGGRFSDVVRRSGAPWWATVLLIAHLVQHAVLLGSWWVLGQAVLQGRIDRGWLSAWALLLLTIAPFRALEMWSVAIVSTRLSAELKRRLLAGALRLDPEETRHQGVGQLLGRILDSESFRFVATTGSHTGIVTLSEIFIAIPVLLAGAAGWPHAVLLVLWTAFAFALWKGYVRRRRAWTAARLEMTHDLVEQMVGHRTRRAQQISGRWHDEEDIRLARYSGLSEDLDRRTALLRNLIPRGWLIVSLAAVAPSFISGSATIASTAVSLGGALFSYWTFFKMVRGLTDLGDAVVAWDQVAPVFHAAARPRSLPAELDVAIAPPAGAASSVVVHAEDLVFRYPGRDEASVAGCTLTIRAGQRVLLEGPSGSGKSTLAALLAGLRFADRGLLLVNGLDRDTLGDEGWRRRVVAAPQFQDNHVFSDTLAFNVLMGREWPPSAKEMEEANVLCRELGLDQLIARMPSGFMQMLGESGWQLSHGEKSRLYIARALAQNAELVILDESFAALDPETLQFAMTTVLRRAHTLLVIAHP